MSNQQKMENPAYVSWHVNTPDKAMCLDLLDTRRLFKDHAPE